MSNARARLPPKRGSVVHLGLVPALLVKLTSLVLPVPAWMKGWAVTARADAQEQLRLRLGGRVCAGPEKKLNSLVKWVVFLEKASDGIGTLAFGWATVVLLGGYVSTLHKIDFAFLTVLMFMQSARFFGRVSDAIDFFAAPLSSDRELAPLSPDRLRQQPLQSHRSTELEQGQLLSDALGTNSENQLQRRPILHFFKHASKFFSSILPQFVLVLLSLQPYVACIMAIMLPLVRMLGNDSYGIAGEDSAMMILVVSLKIFYILVIMQGFMLLMAYCLSGIGVFFNVASVVRKYGFESWGHEDMKKYFDKYYYRCIVDDKPNTTCMDIFSYVGSSLNSDSQKDQLTGARILDSLLQQRSYACEAVLYLQSSPQTIGRMIELLLDLKGRDEQHIKSLIIRNLEFVCTTQLMLIKIEANMNSVSSLFDNSTTEIDPQYSLPIVEAPEVVVLGLLILQRLTQDIDKCKEIINTRGLVSKVIKLTKFDGSLAQQNQSNMKIVKESLKVVSGLVSKTCEDAETGLMLCRVISKDLLLANNIARILEHRSDAELIMLAIEILKNLSLDNIARNAIGSTGKVIRMLRRIFFMDLIQQTNGAESLAGMAANDELAVIKAAGNVLAILAIESPENCTVILTETEYNVAQALISILSNGRNDECVHIAARVLWYLCTYSGDEDKSLIHQFLGANVLAQVLGSLSSMSREALEAYVGLAVEMCKLAGEQVFSRALNQIHGTVVEFAQKLKQILAANTEPTVTSPGIRRYTVELLIWMMKVKVLENNGRLMIDWELRNVIQSTSNIENFKLFCGDVGLIKQTKSLSSVANMALQLVTRDSSNN